MNKKNFVVNKIKKYLQKNKQLYFDLQSKLRFLKKY